MSGASPLPRPHVTATRLTTEERHQLAQLCTASGQQPASLLRHLIQEAYVAARPGLAVQHDEGQAKK
jgi:hypothetical protein